MLVVAETDLFSRFLLCCRGDGGGRLSAEVSEEDEAVCSRSRSRGASGSLMMTPLASRLDDNCLGETRREQASSAEENNRRTDGGSAGCPSEMQSSGIVRVEKDQRVTTGEMSRECETAIQLLVSMIETGAEWQ